MTHVRDAPISRETAEIDHPNDKYVNASERNPSGNLTPLTANPSHTRALH